MPRRTTALELRKYSLAGDAAPFMWRDAKRLYISPYTVPHFKDVAALPCQTVMFQKSYKFKNFKKDVVLKYFCGCTDLYWIFLSSN